MSSGYTAERDRPHAEAQRRFVCWLRDRAYAVRELPVDGYRPDLRVVGPGWSGYVDVKTRAAGRVNIAIATGECDVQMAEWAPCLYVWESGGGWRYADRGWLDLHLIADSRPATERGSNTDWRLYGPADSALLWQFGSRPASRTPEQVDELLASTDRMLAISAQLRRERLETREV